MRLIRPPMTATISPMLMLMGMMTLIVGILEASLTFGYWNHSIANDLTPAVAGSQLLNTLATIGSIRMWLEPLKFIGMALLLSGIGLARAAIVGVPRWQSSRLWEILN